MIEDTNSMHAAATGIIGTFTAVLGFFGIRLIGQVDANTTKIAQHELEDSGKYATNVQVQASLDRIHTRIDVMAEDIKTLLGRPHG